MEGESVRYLGRNVPIEGFRAFVYGANDTTKLVNSWPEYETVIASGLWFPTKDRIPAIEASPLTENAPKKGKNRKGVE